MVDFYITPLHVLDGQSGGNFIDDSFQQVFTLPQFDFRPLPFRDLGRQRLVRAAEFRGPFLHPRFQAFVRLPQSLFGLFALADVGHGDEETQNGSVFIEMGNEAGVGMAGAPGAVRNRVLIGDRFTGQCAFQVSPKGLIGRFAQHFTHMAADHPIAGMPEPFLVGVVDIPVTQFRIHVGDQYGEGIGEQPQLRLTLLEPFVQLHWWSWIV